MEGDDPRSGRYRPTNPFAQGGAYRPTNPFLDEEGEGSGVVGQFLHGAEAGNARMLANLVDLLGDFPELTGGLRDIAEQTRAEAGTPEGLPERLAAGAGEIAPELAAYILGGNAAAAAQLPAGIARLAPFLRHPRAARMASDVVSGLPITVAREAAAPEEHSTAAVLGELTDSDLLRGASESAVGRALAGGAIDVVGGTVVHQLGREVGATVRGLRGGTQDLDSAAEDILRQHAGRTPPQPVPDVPAQPAQRLLPGPGQTTGAIPLPASMAAQRAAEAERSAMLSQARRAYDAQLQAEVDAELTRALQADPERAVLLTPEEVDQWRVNAEKRVLAKRHPGVVGAEVEETVRAERASTAAAGAARLRETEEAQLREMAEQSAAARRAAEGTPLDEQTLGRSAPETVPEEYGTLSPEMREARRSLAAMRASDPATNPTRRRVVSAPAALTEESVDLTAGRLRTALARDGGFTFDPFIGDAHAGGGYAVAFGTRTGRKLAKVNPTSDDVAQWLRANADFFGENARRRVGGWVDPETGVTEIEPSEVHDSIVAALRQARADGEKAIFDLGSFETIFTDSPAARVILEFAERTGRELDPADVEAVLSRYAKEAGGAESAGAAAANRLDEPGGTGSAGGGGADTPGAGGVGRPDPAGDRAPAPGGAAPAGGAAVPAPSPARDVTPAPVAAGYSDLFQQVAAANGRSPEEMLRELGRGFPAQRNATIGGWVGKFLRAHPELEGTGRRWGRELGDEIDRLTPPSSQPQFLQAGAGVAALGAAEQDEDSDNTILFALAAVGLGAFAIKGLRSRAARQALAAQHSTVGLQVPAVRKVLSMLAGTRETPSSTLGEKAEKFYRETFNSLYGLNQFGRAVGDERIVAEAARASGWEEAAHAELRSYYEPVAKLVKGIEPQVAALTISERALELARNGLPNKGVDLRASEQAARELRKIPEVAAAADAVLGYYRRLLDRKLQNRLISVEDYRRQVAKGEFYIPFVRDFMDEAQMGASRGSRGLAQRGKGVRKMTDEEAISKIKNPLLQAIHDTFLTERAVARQRVTTLVAEAVDTNPGVAHQFLQDVTGVSSKYRGKDDVRVVPVTVDGRQREFAIKDDALYDAWAALAPASQDYAMVALRFFKNVERAGITVNPVFAARNSIRDFFSTLIQYPAASRPALGAGVGAAAGAVRDPDSPVEGALKGAAFGATLGAVAPHAWRVLAATNDILQSGLGRRPIGTDVYLEWLREGGSGFGYFPRTEQAAARMFKDLQQRGEMHLKDILNPGTWGEALLALNRTIESAPRLAAYKWFRKQGTGVAEAVAKSRDISVDFAVLGSGQTIRTASGATAFFNAKLQGWDKTFRVLAGERTVGGGFRLFGPKQRQAWMLGLSTITASSIALWNINKDDPEYWKQPLWARNLFWLVPRGDGTFWKVPKPFEVGYLFASIPERFLDWLYQKHPDVFAEPGTHVVSPYSGKGAALEIGKTVVGDLTDVMPTVFTPVIENVTNHDFFRGQPVVPSRLQNLPPEMQFDDRTSSIGRVIGASMGVSPAKVDNLLYGYTGTSGRLVAEEVSRIARATGLDDRGPSAYPQSTGMFSPMVTRLDVLPAPALDVLREMQRVERVKNGLAKTTNFESYFAEHSDDLSRYYQLRPIAQGIERISDIIPVIAQDASAPADVRREQVHALRHMQFQLAQMAAEIEQAPR